MTEEGVVYAIAVLLMLVGPANAYFVWHAHQIHKSVTPRSPLLFALLGVAAVVWVIGLFIAVLAFEAVFDLPALPFAGLLFAIAILGIELLPLFIWVQMRRFFRSHE